MNERERFYHSNLTIVERGKRTLFRNEYFVGQIVQIDVDNKHISDNLLNYIAFLDIRYWIRSKGNNKSD